MNSKFWLAVAQGVLIAGIVGLFGVIALVRDSIGELRMHVAVLEVQRCHCGERAGVEEDFRSTNSFAFQHKL